MPRITVPSDRIHELEWALDEMCNKMCRLMDDIEEGSVETMREVLWRLAEIQLDAVAGGRE